MLSNDINSQNESVDPTKSQSHTFFDLFFCLKNVKKNFPFFVTLLMPFMNPMWSEAETWWVCSTGELY